MNTTPSGNNTAQLIKFPVAYQGPTKDPEEIMRRIHDNKTQAVSDTLGYIVPPLLEALVDIGIDLESNHYKSMLLIALIKNIIADHLAVENELSPFLHKYRKQLQNIADKSILN